MTTTPLTCPAPRHNTMSAYQRAGCRCPKAREAHRLYYKRARTGRPYRTTRDATGTRRRIQALHALGHTATTIATQAGLNYQVIQRMALPNPHHQRITAAAHQAITSAYNTLRQQPGTSRRVAMRAARNHWPAPDEWDAWGDIDDPPTPRAHPTSIIDEIAIDMVLHGERGLDILTDAEQAHLYTTLTSQGLSSGQIRHRLGASASQVSRMARHARKEPTP